VSVNRPKYLFWPPLLAPQFGQFLLIGLGILVLPACYFGRSLAGGVYFVNAKLGFFNTHIVSATAGRPTP
jgi:hypothetical protein